MYGGLRREKILGKNTASEGLELDRVPTGFVKVGSKVITHDIYGNKNRADIDEIQVLGMSSFSKPWTF